MEQSVKKCPHCGQSLAVIPVAEYEPRDLRCDACQSVFMDDDGGQLVAIAGPASDGKIY